MTDDTLTPEQVAEIRSRDLFYLTMKETTALCDTVDTLREQLRRKDTALDEWIAAYYHNTAQIRSLTDALRGAKEDRDLCARRMKAIETAHRRRLAHFLAEGESDG
ncbi:hypothetical protein LCGC14_3153940 [marine sediment metagenome]|uniref:Uncharacterized protein n=1 Tax=marine sediment metagenome TaxID=412755 RepID=A0A0F8VTB0_9ZZZZ